MSARSSSRVVRGGLSLVVRQMFSFPLNALGVAIASRELTTAHFAIQSFIVPIIGMTFFLIDLGTSRGIVLHKSNPGRRTTRDLFVVKAAATAVLLLIAYLLSSIVLGEVRSLSGLLPLLPLCLITASAQSCRSYTAALLQRELEWSFLARVEVIEILIYNMALGLFAAAFHSAACFPLALLFRYLGGWILLARGGHKAKAADVQRIGLKELMRHGLPLDLVVLVGILNNAALPIIGSLLMGVNQLGIVAWSFTVSNLVLIPLRPLPDFFLSVLSARSRENRDDKDLVRSLLELGNILMLISTFVMLRAFDLLLIPIFHDRWIDSTVHVHILFVANLTTFPCMMLSSVLAVKGFGNTWFRVNVLGTILLWTLCPVGIWLAGPIGFSAGWLVATLVAALSLGILSQDKRVVSGSLFISLLPCWILIIGELLPTLYGAIINDSLATILKWTLTPLLALIWVGIERKRVDSAVQFVWGGLTASIVGNT